MPLYLAGSVGCKVLSIAHSLPLFYIHWTGLHTLSDCSYARESENWLVSTGVPWNKKKISIFSQTHLCTPTLLLMPPRRSCVVSLQIWPPATASGAWSSRSVDLSISTICGTVVERNDGRNRGARWEREVRSWGWGRERWAVAPLYSSLNCGSTLRDPLCPIHCGVCIKF